MKSVLTALLSTAYKVEPEKITELLEKSEDELATELLELDKQRVASFKAAEKKRFNDGHAKGLSETMSKFEKSLREKFDIDDDLTGEELVQRIIEVKTEEVAKSGKAGKVTVTEDDIKKSPLYIQMQNEFQTKLKTAEGEWKGKFEQREAEINKEKTLHTVRKSALDVLNELKPILPEDAKIAEKHKEWFLKEFESLNYEIGADGKIIPKDSEGKPIEDAHGSIRSFEDLVKEKAQTSFTFNVSQERSSTGNGKPTATTKPGMKPAAGPTGNKVLPKPKTVAEMAEIANNREAFTLEERQQIAKEFQERQTVVA